ncbi:MAG: CvpA family protein [Verrucomicrobiota bacterium]
MIATVIFIVALLLVFLAAQIGLKAGAFPALTKMIAALLSLFIAMRYWYPCTRFISSYDTASLYVITLVVFWALFLLVYFFIQKLCDSHLETFESVEPSLVSRILGALFGSVTGAVVVMSVMMTTSILAPHLLPSYTRPTLPIPVDAGPEFLFRMVESRVAGVKRDDPVHTPLPKLENAASVDPATFWQ